MKKVVKKTPTKKTSTSKAPINISHCNVTTNFNFDEDAIMTIGSIAMGLCENAKGLTALANVLRTSNIKIGPAINVTTETTDG